jgi:hypothetical protein
MRSPATDLPNQEDENAFLQEGARSYVAAKHALETFERDVQAKCRAVVEQRVKADEKSLGFDVGKLSEYTFYQVESAGTKAGLGVRVKNIKVTPEIAAEWYCCLWWEEGVRRKLGIDIEMWLSDQKVADELRAALDPAKGADQDKKYVWLWKELQPDDVASFPDLLDDGLARWSKALKKAGGLTALAARAYAGTAGG